MDREQIIIDTLANIKLDFMIEYCDDVIVLMVESNGYCLKLDVTDKVLQLVNELKIDEVNVLKEEIAKLKTEGLF